MTEHRSVEDPLLCVTVLEAAVADIESLLQATRSQQLSDCMFVCSEQVSQDFKQSLRDLGFTVETLFEKGVSLHDYWCALDQYFHKSERPVLVLNAASTLAIGAWVRFPYQALCTGSVCFPLSVRNALSTIFQSVEHKPGLPSAALDHWLNRFAGNELLELPAPAGFCGVLMPSCSERPLRFLLTEAVFVDDRALQASPVPSTLALAHRQAILERHPLTGLRHAMTEVSERSEEPPTELKRSLAVRLHISHGWGGGLANWIQDFVHADSDARSLILRPIGDRSAYGQTMALYEADTPQVPVMSRTFTMPIISTLPGHYEYQQWLTQIISSYSVDAVFVSSLIGHSMDVLDTGLPTVFVLHNFFPTCPAIIATFDGPCESCSPARMEQCFANNDLQKYFLLESVEHWHAIRAAFSEYLRRQSMHIVAPSASVLTRFQQILGEADPVPGHVIPHGLPNARAEALGDCQEPTSAGNEKLVVLVLGGQEAHKGGALAAALVKRLPAQTELVLLGFGDSLGAVDNVTVIDSYTSEELPKLIRQHAPDVGLLLSMVPETFSYTLSELQCAGVPAIATRLGAFVERIVDGSTGWLVEPTVESVAKRLRAVSQNRDALLEVRQRVQALAPRRADQMVNDYLALLPPAARFAKARPSGSAKPGMTQEALFLVDPKARYLDAVRAFVQYSIRKASLSPRLPAVIRSWLARR